MVYVYRERPSDSARDLSEAMEINCRRLNDLNRAHFGQGVRAGDRVICWGQSMTPREGVQVLNGTPILNKFEDAVRLKAAGVATIEVARTQPPAINPIDHYEIQGGRLTRDQLRAAVDAAQRFLATPPPLPIEWLGRRFHHVGGNDLLVPTRNPDYYAQKETITNEYRIHMFLGKSIRAGQKVARGPEFRQHPWIRSLDGGWKIDYNGFTSTRAMRDLCTRACQALSLDFAAIDLAQKADGTLMVLEANRAPGLEGGTIEAYVGAITRWTRGEEI